MIKFIILLVTTLFLSIASVAQYTFSFIEKYTDENRLKAIADSIKMPLLKTENKIYSIGSSCITRLIDGSINDRNDDGDNSDRMNDGSNNKRNQAGASADRSSKGNKGKRKKNGGDNDRDADGDSNDRDKNGDNNDRNKDGDSDNRNSDGDIANGTRCSVAKNGRILLYTREKINTNKCTIYYKTQYFSSKYFKIIKI
jgi:hypothetical protein